MSEKNMMIAVLKPLAYPNVSFLKTESSQSQVYSFVLDTFSNRHFSYAFSGQTVKTNPSVLTNESESDSVRTGTTSTTTVKYCICNKAHVNIIHIELDLYDCTTEQFGKSEEQCLEYSSMKNISWWNHEPFDSVHDPIRHGKSTVVKCKALHTT